MELTLRRIFFITVTIYGVVRSDYDDHYSDYDDDNDRHSTITSTVVSG